jgi:hypothetical protein
MRNVTFYRTSIGFGKGIFFSLDKATLRNVYVFFFFKTTLFPLLPLFSFSSFLLRYYALLMILSTPSLYSNALSPDVVELLLTSGGDNLLWFDDVMSRVKVPAFVREGVFLLLLLIFNI